MRGLYPLAIVVVLSSVVVGQGDGEENGPQKGRPTEKKATKKKPSYDLIAWGQLKPVKSEEGFFELAYTKTVKRKRKKMVAFVKLGDGLKVLEDRRATAKQLQAGTRAFVLGKVFEKSNLSATGLTSSEFSMRNVQALLIGGGIKVNTDYRDPRDEEIMWYNAVIADSKKGLALEIDENEHRTTLDRKTLIIQRRVAEPSVVAGSGKAFYGFVLANRSDERPRTKKRSDEKKESFVTSRVILLDSSAVKSGLYYKIYK